MPVTGVIFAVWCSYGGSANEQSGYDILPAYGVFDIFKDPDIPRGLEVQAAFGETLPVILNFVSWRT
jgi:hypothetical protein